MLRALRVEALRATESTGGAVASRLSAGTKVPSVSTKVSLSIPGDTLSVILAFRRSIRSRGGLAASPSNAFLMRTLALASKRG